MKIPFQIDLKRNVAFPISPEIAPTFPCLMYNSYEKRWWICMGARTLLLYLAEGNTHWATQFRNPDKLPKKPTMPVKAPRWISEEGQQVLAEVERRRIN